MRNTERITEDDWEVCEKAGVHSWRHPDGYRGLALCVYCYVQFRIPDLTDPAAVSAWLDEPPKLPVPF